MNKKIVITGGSKGIGKAIAEKFVKEGFDVAICARSEKYLRQTQREFIKKYPKSNIIAKVVNVRDKEALKEFSNDLIRSWADIDILINNAGTFIPGAIHSEDDGVLEQMIETNLYSAYNITRYLLPAIQNSTKGHIFNICSVASIKAYPNGGSYAISKFGLLGFSKCLREELMEMGVRVTAVLPGATWSDSWKGVNLPKGRLMQGKDIASLIWSAYCLDKSANLEELVVRPLLGDL